MTTGGSYSRTFTSLVRPGKIDVLVCVERADFHPDESHKLMAVEVDCSGVTTPEDAVQAIAYAFGRGERAVTWSDEEGGADARA